MPSTINGASGSGGLTAAASSAALKSSNVTQDQFLKLLVTELQNQDPLNPLSNENFLTQLAQFQSLQETMETANNTKNLLLSQQLAAASALIGKNVVAKAGSGQVYGTVGSVIVTNGVVNLMVGDTAVGISDITAIYDAASAATGAK